MKKQPASRGISTQQMGTPMNTTLPCKKLLATAAVAAAVLSIPVAANATTNGNLLLNRVGPVLSELYIANADGTGEHKLIPTAGFDYHASFSKDGQWIVFTSERDGLGQSNIYRVKADGTGLQQLTSHVAVDDGACLLADRFQHHRLRLLAQRRLRLRQRQHLDAEHRHRRAEECHRLAGLRP
jgi:hypothetical protein